MIDRSGCPNPTCIPQGEHSIFWSYEGCVKQQNAYLPICRQKPPTPLFWAGVVGAVTVNVDGRAQPDCWTHERAESWLAIANGHDGSGCERQQLMGMLLFPNQVAQRQYPHRCPTEGDSATSSIFFAKMSLGSATSRLVARGRKTESRGEKEAAHDGPPPAARLVSPHIHGVAQSLTIRPC